MAIVGEKLVGFVYRDPNTMDYIFMYPKTVAEQVEIEGRSNVTVYDHVTSNEHLTAQNKSALVKAGQPIPPELLKAAGLDQYGDAISKLSNAYALSFSSGGSGGGGGSGRGSGSGGGGNGSGSEPAAPSAGPSGNENKPTLQNYMNNIAGRVSAIDRNKSLSYTQKAAKKAALVDQLYAWVDQGNISPADAGHIIEAYDLRGTTSAEREANTQNKRKVDKEGRGFE